VLLTGGAEGAEGASGVDIGPTEVGPVSILGLDPLGMLSVRDDELLPGLSILDDELPMEGTSMIDDDDDPESLLGDGGAGSLGESGNDPGPALARGSGNAAAFASPAPIETELNPRPVMITALTTRCFAVTGSVVLNSTVVLTARLPVRPSYSRMYAPGLSTTCDFPSQQMSFQPQITSAGVELPLARPH